MRGERLFDAGEGRAGSGSHEARFGVDGDRVQPSEVGDERGPEDGRGPHEAAPAAARDDRHTRGRRPAHGGGQLAHVRRHDHGERATGDRTEVRTAAERPERVEARSLTDGRIGVDGEGRARGVQPLEHARG